MSDLTDAATNLSNAATRANKTTDFFDDVTTLGPTSTVKNPNNNKTVPSVQKQVKDLFDALPPTEEFTELEAAALAAGTTYDNITYSTNLVDEIKGYMFDASGQITYAVPEAAQGKFISSVVGGVLTTTDMSEYELISYPSDRYTATFKNDSYGSAVENMVNGLVGGSRVVDHKIGNIYVTGLGKWLLKTKLGVDFSLADFEPLSSIFADDFGAKADAGITNNTPVFLKISEFLNSRGGYATVEFSASIMTPYVYEQHKGVGDSSYWGVSDIFSLNSLEGVSFKGNKSSIKLADGTKFGSFDPSTGVATAGRQTSSVYANGGGRFLHFTNCSKVSINDIYWNGNVSNHEVGGGFGDLGWQVAEYGLRLSGTARDVAVSDCSFGHSGLDGLALAVSNDIGIIPNVSFRNVTCRNNGRQGLSFTGGSYFSFYNCDFSATGRDTLSSPPAAGVDIEPEGGRYVANNTFTNCSMHDCVGAGLLTAVGSSRMYNNKFSGCSMIGTTSTPLYLTSASRVISAVLDSCDIRGSVTVTGNTAFTECNFTDEPLDDYPSIYSSTYMLQNIGVMSTQKDCTYTITKPNTRVWYVGKGITNAKVYAAWDTDDAEGNHVILGTLGLGDTLNGNIAVYDKLSGTTPISVASTTQIVNELSGPIYVKENNGLISPPADTTSRDNCPEYYFAAVKSLFTGILLTSKESVAIGRNFGPVQITVDVASPVYGYYQRGDEIRNKNKSPGGIMGWVCTTTGDVGTTAVIKEFGSIEV